MNNESNRILLVGSVAEELTYSHRIFGENFYNFKVSVTRKSGVPDVLPVTSSERLLPEEVKAGDRCALSGQIRTYNESDGEKNHLKIVVFCREISFAGSEEEGNECDRKVIGRICAGIKRYSECRQEDHDADTNDKNDVLLEGFLCRQPYYRVSPLGREICDIMLAVNRIHGKSDYIPCIAWGRNARFVSTLDVGSKLTLRGRLQSRNYKKTLPDGSCELRIAYELSVMSIECE